MWFMYLKLHTSPDFQQAYWASKYITTIKYNCNRFRKFKLDNSRYFGNSLLNYYQGNGGYIIPVTCGDLNSRPGTRRRAPVKCGLADRRTCNLQTEILRTATADQWVNCGPLICGPHSMEAVGKTRKTDSKDADDDEDEQWQKRQQRWRRATAKTTKRQQTWRRTTLKMTKTTAKTTLNDDKNDQNDAERRQREKRLQRWQERRRT